MVFLPKIPDRKQLKKQHFLSIMPNFLQTFNCGLAEMPYFLLKSKLRRRMCQQFVYTASTLSEIQARTLTLKKVFIIC